MANYIQIFPPLVFSYRLFIFTNRGNFQVRTWVWRKFAAENCINFQRGDWTGVKWSSQSRKTNFLTLPDLAFGFVHKRSGNEITHCGVGNLIASLDFMLRVGLIPWGVINNGEDKPSCIQSERYPIHGRLAEKQRLAQALFCIRRYSRTIYIIFGM